MFFIAGARLWQFGAMGLMGIGAALVVGLQEYQITRIRTFLDPWSDPLGTGFHTIQGLLALGLGGIFGAGLGESKLAGGLYLPNAWNDFIFAIIGEEFGLIGTVTVVALFVVLAYAGIRTAMRAPGYVRRPAGHRHHRLAVHPGLHQHRRRRRAAAGHGHHPSVHQRRRFVAHHQLCRRRDPRLDLAGNGRAPNPGARCEC